MPVMNTPPNTWNFKTIGEWLLKGMQNWDDIENPWINAFPPLALHNDLDLERQLVSYFTKAGDESAEHLQQGLLWALTKWRLTKHSHMALKGLLYMVTETKVTEPYASRIWELLTKDLQTNTPEANAALLTVVNTLASMSPDTGAVELLKKFHALGEPKWRPNFAALTFIAYIVKEPDAWPRYLAELHSDLKSIEEKLNPKIFFVRVSNILGIERIAGQLHQLDMKSDFVANAEKKCMEGEIDADKWFVDKLLGLPNSPVFAMNEKECWYLRDRNAYPVGKKFRVDLPDIAEYSQISKRFPGLFNGYNNEEACLVLVKQLLAAYAGKGLGETDFEIHARELFSTFGEPIVLHYIASVISVEQFDGNKREQIKQLLTKIASYSIPVSLPEPEQSILKIIDELSTEGVNLTYRGIQKLLLPFCDKENALFESTPEVLYEILDRLSQKGLIVGQSNLRLSSFYVSQNRNNVNHTNRIGENFIMEIIPELQVEQKIFHDAQHALTIH